MAKTGYPAFARWVSPLSLIRQGLRWIHLLSLDAALAGLAWQELFASATGWTLHPVDRVILPLAIWMAYTADRLWDARKFETDKPSTERLRFHHRHWRHILVVWLLTFFGSIALAWHHYAIGVFLAGFVLIILIQAYYLLSHWARKNSHLRLSKDLATACLFACGSSFFILTQQPEKNADMLWLQAGLALLSLLNLQCIGWMERPLDLEQAQVSSALLHRGSLGIILLTLASLLYAGGICIAGYHRFGTALLLATLLLGMASFAFRKTSSETFRQLADWPLILMIFLA